MVWHLNKDGFFKWSKSFHSTLVSPKFSGFFLQIPFSLPYDGKWLEIIFSNSFQHFHNTTPISSDSNWFPFNDIFNFEYIKSHVHPDQMNTADVRTQTFILRPATVTTKVDNCAQMCREVLNSVDRFTALHFPATSAPLATTCIKTLSMNQYAWWSVTLRMK
jgi:hypothetical protein